MYFTDFQDGHGLVCKKFLLLLRRSELLSLNVGYGSIHKVEHLQSYAKILIGWFKLMELKVNNKFK